tara:strand:+ start:1050 stop:1499 length:450 start_codon:yes stop_codon:yes gene_type:complete
MAEKIFAIIDTNNIVTDDMVLDVDTEEEGVQQARDILNNQTATVVETFSNANDAATRYNFGGVGNTWDATNNAFIEPQPFTSWSLDVNYKWQAPGTPYGDTSSISDDYYVVEWDEDNLRWNALDTATETVTNYWDGSAWVDVVAQSPRG